RAAASRSVPGPSRMSGTAGAGVQTPCLCLVMPQTTAIFLIPSVAGDGQCQSGAHGAVTESAGMSPLAGLETRWSHSAWRKVDGAFSS
ncbi:MAG: hypothetical protein OXD45_14435, partial [Rhodobacteraceae bacterium]|nr:hypothetical protein [Paracoccaceae bacterium]